MARAAFWLHVAALSGSIQGMTDLVRALAQGPAHAFSDWPVDAVPDVAAGVYAIWDQDRLVYVGMSGRGRSKEELDELRAKGKRSGLFGRLASHASGARSGDQFCVYVADLLVLPHLSAEQMSAIGARKLRFDTLVKDYVHERLTFRFMETDDGAEALRIEAELKAGALGQAPLLNPAS